MVLQLLLKVHRFVALIGLWMEGIHSRLIRPKDPLPVAEPFLEHFLSELQTHLFLLCVQLALCLALAAVDALLGAMHPETCR